MSKPMITFSTIIAVILAAPAIASAFWPGTVSGVPSGQTLSIRKTASPNGLQVGDANNGDSLSLTGRCRKLKPNGGMLGNFRIDVSGTPAWRAAKISQARTRCEVWFEVTPSNFKAVWARGSFITPG